MDMNNIEDNKIIDWELGAQLAGGKREIAKDMLQMLTNELPQNLQDITQAVQAQDYPTLKRLVHKLRGGTCYCGVPRLKIAADNLDAVLKANQFDNVDALAAELCQEINNVLDSAKTEGIV